MHLLYPNLLPKHSPTSSSHYLLMCSHSILSFLISPAPPRGTPHPKDAIGPGRLALFLTGGGGRGRREKAQQASRKGPPQAPLEPLMPGPVSCHEMPQDRAGARPGSGQECAPWKQHTARKRHNKEKSTNCQNTERTPKLSNLNNKMKRQRNTQQIKVPG